MNVPKKKRRRAEGSIKLRPLFWSTIHYNKIDSTIFKEINDADAHINIGLLEFKFRKNADILNKLNKSNTSSSKKEGDDDAKTKKTALVSLVDGRRSQNCGIALARFKSSPAQIKTAILTLDSTVLTIDACQLLQRLVPTKEEHKSIKTYLDAGKPLSQLATVDRFLALMASVPKCLERLQCYEIQHTFKARAEDISQQLTLVERNVSNVLSSIGIKELLMLAMATGNYVNDGSRRGGAYGFKLDALLKMKDVKSCDDPKYTLMHYMAETASKDVKTYCNALQLPGDELESLGAAARVQISQIAEDTSNLKLSKLLLEREVKSNHGAAFVLIMRPLLDRIVIPMYEKVNARLTKLKVDAEALVSRFGENPKDMTVDMLFSLLKKSLEAWSSCKMDLKNWEEKALKAKQKADSKQKKKKNMKNMQGLVAAEMAKKLARRAATKGSGLQNPGGVSTKLHQHARRLSSQLKFKKK